MSNGEFGPKINTRTTVCRRKALKAVSGLKKKIYWCKNECAVFCSESPTIFLKYAKDKVIGPLPAP